MYMYKQLPEADERYPAWCRVVVPDGASNYHDLAARRGWRIDFPKEVRIYREDGELLSDPPQAQEQVKAVAAAPNVAPAEKERKQ